MDPTMKPCAHGAVGIEPACEECLDAHLTWSAKAHERSGFADAEKIVRAHAGKLFAHGRDSVAQEVRALADELNRYVKTLDKEVDEARLLVEKNREGHHR